MLYTQRLRQLWIVWGILLLLINVPFIFGLYEQIVDPEVLPPLQFHEREVECAKVVDDNKMCQCDIVCSVRLLTYVLWAIPTALLAIFSPFANNNTRLPLRWYVILPSGFLLAPVVEIIFKQMAEYLQIDHNPFKNASDYPAFSVHEAIGFLSHYTFMVVTILLFVLYFFCWSGDKTKKA